MNNRDYIESGILELYAAGALNSVERTEVEQMLTQHKELRDELNAIELALESYAMAYQKQPSAGLFNTILTKVETGIKPQQTSAKTIELTQPKKTTGNIIRYFAYAASLLLFVSVAINVYYYSNYQRVQDELAQMKDQNTMLADQYGVIQADFNSLKNDMNVIKSPSYMAVTMKGQPVSPNSIAVVYWDKTTGQVYINANNLPAPENGKQYQLWALKDGKPIDAGVFDMNGQMQLMKNITEADAFAVTLEPVGGLPAPSGSIYVVGNV